MGSGLKPFGSPSVNGLYAALQVVVENSEGLLMLIGGRCSIQGLWTPKFCGLGGSKVLASRMFGSPQIASCSFGGCSCRVYLANPK